MDRSDKIGILPLVFGKIRYLPEVVKGKKSGENAKKKYKVNFHSSNRLNFQLLMEGIICSIPKEQVFRKCCF